MELKEMKKLLLLAVLLFSGCGELVENNAKPPYTPEPCDVRWYIVKEQHRGKFSASLQLGFDPFFLVVDCVTEARHSQIDSIASVTFPLNIDNTITSVNNVKSKLANHDIPNYWVTTSTTWRELIRFIANYTQVYQSLFSVVKDSFFVDGVTMTTQYRDLPQQQKNALQNMANEFEFDKSGITGSSTVRQILKEMIDQIGDEPLVLGGQAL